MVLLDLCRRNELRITVAHVNYGLRGAESDADEALVTSYCEKHNIPCEVMRASANDWKTHSGSTQESARKMRYRWFDALIAKHGAARVITAHHANDQTETMLMQFIRGGAGKSVYGMSVDNGTVLRPLLAATRAELIAYAQENAVLWREDQSNQSDYYTRNKIRHHIVPEMEAINPSIHKSIQQRSEWMHQEQLLLNDTLAEKWESLIRRDADAVIMDVDALQPLPYLNILMWFGLKPMGFSSEVVVDVVEKIRAPRSSEPVWFSSQTHEVCIQNNMLACIEKQQPTAIQIDALPWSDDSIALDECRRSEVKFGNDAAAQYLDAERMTLPLVIRNWQEGDSFKPLGAPGRQKISDFFTHAKIPAWKKKHVRVLESHGEILAVLGYRISNDFKLTDRSTSCLRVTFR